MKAATHMIEDAIEDDANVASMGFVDQGAEGVVTAEERVDGEEVGRVVAMVGGGPENGVEVDGADAKVGEVVELLHDTEEVAALEAVPCRGRVPRFEVSGLGNIGAGGETVGENLVED